MSAKTWKINPSKRRPRWLVVIGPRDEDFVAALKSEFRHGTERDYCGVMRAWLVHEDRRDDIERIIEEHSETERPDAPVPDGLVGARALLGRAQDLGEDITVMVAEELDEGLRLGLETHGVALAGAGDLVVVRFTDGGKRFVLVGAIMSVG